MNSSYQSDQNQGEPAWLLADEDGKPAYSGNGDSHRISKSNNGSNSGDGSRHSLSPSEAGSIGRGRNGRRTGGERKSISGDLYDEYDVADQLIDCYCCHVDPAILSLQLFHFSCLMLSFASAFANIYEVTHDIKFGEVDLRDKLIRGFGALFSILASIIELDLRFFSKYVSLFDFWIFRGLLYILIGSITLQLERPLNKFQNITGLGDIAAAFVYFIMVCFCVRSISERRQERFRNVRGYSDIDDI